MGFRLNLRWAPSVQPSFASNSSSLPASYSLKSNETVYDPSRMPFQSVIHEERVAFLGDQRCSLSTQALENESTRGAASVSYSMPHNNGSRAREASNLKHLTSFRGTKALYFSLLMKNLDILEETVADSELIRLERDILVQLERLGALKLFQTCLSRTIKSSTSSNSSNSPSDLVEEAQASSPPDQLASKVLIRSARKEERKSRRKRSLVGSSKALERHSKTNAKDHQQRVLSSRSRVLNCRIKRQKIAKSEAEMSRGVKLVAELERIRTKIEEEVGQVVSMSSWAQAAGIDKKVLLQQMHYGWYCRDELLRSTRSLVLYIAKNYRGLGVAFEDLVQAGNMGVLQGAERFDHARGYQFSTYVQYWIRKSISALVAKHARGIRIPSSLSKAINTIQKARKALSNRDGKHPEVNEIAKFTGLTTAKISSASKCLKVVGSVDQKVGDCMSAKFLEIIPDTSIRSPEETVVRQHMTREVYNLLKGLEPRERQVLLLRFGLKSHPRKSLEEIGRLFSVSKEWVRKIERKALTKLRKQDTLKNPSHCLYM